MGARDITLNWVPGAGSPSAGYVVYVTTVSGVYQAGSDIGPRSPDATGVVSYTLQGAADDDVYVQLTAYSDEGVESAPSNEVHFPPDSFPPPDPDSVVVHVTEGVANPLLDGAEGRVVDIAGLGVVYVVSMDPRGRIQGSGAADLSGDGQFETAFGVSGRIRGNDTELDGKLKLVIKSGIGEDKTNLKALLRRHVDSLQGSDDEDARLSGKWSGVPTQEQELSSVAIDPAELGWRVSFKIDEQAEGNRKPAAGDLLYGNGKSIPISGSAVFREATGTWDVRLKSLPDERGVKMRFTKLELAGTDIQAGRLAYKAFGQKGRMELPQPF